MRQKTILVWGILLFPAALSAQPLVPLADAVDKPLLPTGISNHDVELFGSAVYLWPDDDGAEVIHFVGDFELHLGRRRIRSREAVIWMTARLYQGWPYHHFEMLLWRDARVVEPAGTTTTGPVLFATLNSAGKVIISADRRTYESSRDTPLYAEARRIRERARARLAPDTQTPSPVTVVDLGPARRRERPEVRPGIAYRGKNLTMEEIDGRPVVTAIGDVYLFRGDPTGVGVIEIRADAAVIYLTAPGEQEDVGEELRSPAAPFGGPGGVREPLGALGTPVAPAGEPLSFGLAQAAYLEGDVILTWGERTVRASRLYYDFENNRALILDAVAFMPAPNRDVPIYVRARQIRQLSSTEWSATDARVTTSEFYTPHYHLGAAKVEFVDRTRRGPAGQVIGPRAGTYTMHHTTFNLGGFPLLYWPYARGDFEEEVSPLRRVRTGYSDDFGAELETGWRLFSLLGLARPPGFDATLRLDYYTERGPGVGVNVDYERDNYFGLFRGYYIRDSGEDNLGRFRDNEFDTPNRGRVTWRHRHFLPRDWQLTWEVSYISDRNFLEEYFEREFDQGKEQETLFYLKKQRDNWAFTLLGQWRILDFLTQTEHLPDLEFRLIGQSLGGIATLFSENRAGFVRYRFRDQTLFENLRLGRNDSSGTTARGDTRQEIELPFDLGPLRVVPFASIRGSAWDDSPERGGLQRVFGTYGVRSSVYLWRVYEGVRSQLLDIQGLRHIIKSDVTAWGAHTNVDSHELFGFDENVEDIDEMDGVTFGVRQRWQTRRGDPLTRGGGSAAGASHPNAKRSPRVKGEPERRRTVDWITFDVEVGLFNDAQPFEFTNGFASYRRPENSIARNYLNTSFIWRISDSTALLSESNFDLNDREMDVFDLSFAVERRPRLSYLVGYRFIEETDSNLLGFGANYRLSPKYTLALREEFDLERGDTEEFTLAVIRKFPRWYVGMTFQLDRIEDDVGVSLSAWPEGAPRAALGSRRFTGLATSTGIRP